MKLTFVDRFAIKNLIPDQANIIKGMLFNSIAKKVNFTPEEIDRHELLNEETIINNITETIDVVFEESELAVLRERGSTRWIKRERFHCSLSILIAR